MSAVLPSGLPLPLPMADMLDAPFWEATRRHELVVQRCSACGTWQWGPEWICYVCHELNPAFVPTDAVGVIYSWQRVWHPVHPALRDHVPYIVLLVELPQAGGVRMLGNLVGDPTIDPRIGAPVIAVFEDHDDVDPPCTLVQWRIGA